MANAGIAAALQSLGQSAPAIGRGFDMLAKNRYEMKRKNMLDDIERQKRERRQMALDQLGKLGIEFTNALEMDAGKSRMYDEAQARMEALPEERRAMLPEHAQQLPSREAAIGSSIQKLGIPQQMEQLQMQYADVPEVAEASKRFDEKTRFMDPQVLRGVQQFADSTKDKFPVASQFINLTSNLGMGDLAFKAAGQTSGKEYQDSDKLGRSAQATRLKFAQDNPEIVEAAKEAVSKFRGTYSDAQLDLLQEIASVDPIRALDGLERMRRSTEQAVTTTEEKIPVEVMREQALRPEKAKTAASTSYASTQARETAPARLSDKITDTLLSSRAQYANLSQARGLFDDKFVTPYLGKSIKLGWLSKNNPEFGDFMTSLASFANEYRHSLFGAALTEGEAAAFTDVINPDLNISPGVFKRQIARVSDIIADKYADQVNTFQQQNYIVPDNLRDIQAGSRRPAQTRQYESVRSEVFGENEQDELDNLLGGL